MYNALTVQKFWTPFNLRLRAITWLRIVAIALAAIHFGLVIALAVTNNYTMSAFTLWSFTALAVLHVALVLAVFFEDIVLTLTMMFGLPFNVGTVWAVCVGIIFFILDNETLLTDNTTCDPSAPSDARSLGLTNAGNWIEHGWPVLDVILLLVAGGDYFGRYIIVRTLSGWSSLGQWLYFGYFMLCPFPLLIIFDAVLSFGDTYPTSFSWWTRTAIAVGAVLPCQLFLFMSLITITRLDQVDPYWLPSVLDPNYSPFTESSKQFTGQTLRLEQEAASAAAAATPSTAGAQDDDGF